MGLGDRRPHDEYCDTSSSYSYSQQSFPPLDSSYSHHQRSTVVESGTATTMSLLQGNRGSGTGAANQFRFSTPRQQTRGSAGAPTTIAVKPSSNADPQKNNTINRSNSGGAGGGGGQQPPAPAPQPPVPQQQRRWRWGDAPNASVSSETLMDSNSNSGGLRSPRAGFGSKLISDQSPSATNSGGDFSVGRPSDIDRPPLGPRRATQSPLVSNAGKKGGGSKRRSLSERQKLALQVESLQEVGNPQQTGASNPTTHNYATHQHRSSGSPAKQASPHKRKHHVSLRSSGISRVDAGDDSGLVSVDDEHFLPSPYLRPPQITGWDKSGSSRHIWSSTQPESLAMSSFGSSSWERTYSSSRVQFAEQALIGKGSSGKVYRAMDRETNRLIAVKEIPLGHLPNLTSQSSFSGSPHSRRRSSLTIFVTEQGLSANAELDVLRQLDHPNIVKYLGEETDMDAGCIRIYMDLVSGGSIRSLLNTYGKLHERQAASYTRQVLDGLVYLHSKHIVHRDLKGDNLLVEPSGVLKLADFGTAGMVSALAHSKETGGTAFFMSPEVLTNEKVISEKADIWSVGCCVLEMMVGKPPLVKLHSQYAIMMMIAESKGELLHHYLPPESSTWSPELQDFLRCCLRRNPDERPSAEELLHHSWIMSISTPQSFSNTNTNDLRLHSRITVSHSPARGEPTPPKRGSSIPPLNPVAAFPCAEEETAGLTSSSPRQHHRSTSSRNTSARPTKLDWNWGSEKHHTFEERHSSSRIPEVLSSRSYTVGRNRGKRSPSSSSLFMAEEDDAQFLDVTYPQRSRPSQQRDESQLLRGSTSEKKKRQGRRDTTERHSRRGGVDDDLITKEQCSVDGYSEKSRVCPRWVKEPSREKESGASSSSRAGYDVFPSLSPRGKKGGAL